MVRYKPRNFKHYPPYRSLGENVITNGTLPSISFGRGTCSQKWKISPQDAWTKTWPAAVECWARGDKVVKLIGCDCSPADNRRYAEVADRNDPYYQHRYPLREWGWTRDDCIARIVQAGVPVPSKSACFFCAASKPEEIRALPPALLRQIVLMEARAAPRLRNVEGLWRTAVKGARGAQARPGSMTAFIRAEELLPAGEIDAIAADAPAELTRFQDAVADRPAERRPEVSRWLTLFDAFASEPWRISGVPGLYDNVGRSDARP